MPEQRNPYKGSPPRPWLQIVLVAAGGQKKQIHALADTGNPCALIVSADVLSEFNVGLAPGMTTNFGPLEGGWLRVQLADIGFDEDLVAYGNDAVAEATAASHQDLQALAGLPLLRMFEYGGNQDAFWVRES